MIMASIINTNPLVRAAIPEKLDVPPLTIADSSEETCVNSSLFFRSIICSIRFKSELALFHHKKVRTSSLVTDHIKINIEVKSKKLFTPLPLTNCLKT
jgi:hypothetical protein